jgi:hypothetical protein
MTPYVKTVSNTIQQITRLAAKKDENVPKKVSSLAHELIAIVQQQGHQL